MMIRSSILPLVLMSWGAHAISNFRVPGLAKRLNEHQENYARRFLDQEEEEQEFPVRPPTAQQGDDLFPDDPSFPVPPPLLPIEFCEIMATENGEIDGSTCACTQFSDGVVEFECVDNCLYCDVARNSTTSCGNFTSAANLTDDSSFVGSVSGYSTTFDYDGAGGRNESLTFEQYGCDENFVCAECRAYINSEMCNSCTYCDNPRGSDAFEVDCENLAANSSFKYCDTFSVPPGVFQAIDYDIVECFEPPPGPPPFNDNCTNATAIADGDSIFGALDGALPDTETLPVCPTETGTAGVWFTFEGTGTPMVASTCSNFNEELYSESFVSLYQGSECGLLECALGAFQDPYCSGFYRGGTSVSVFTEIGVTYYAYVSDRYGYLSTYDLTLTAFAEPLNDQCLTAGEIEVDGDSIFGTAIFQPDGGELNACGLTFENDSEAWYQFVAPEDGTLRASTCPPSTSGWFTGITIVGGTCDSQECMAETQPFRYIQGCGESGNILDFEVTAGNVYTIVVWGPIFANVAFFELSLRTLNPPENNDCEDAVMIDVDEAFTGSLGDTTLSPDEMMSTCVSNFDFEFLQGGVWYSFVGTGEVMQATSCSDDFSHFVSIFAGSCGSLECVSEANWTPPNECRMYRYGHRSNGVLTVAGETYYALVSPTDFGAEGTFDFSMESFVPAENDECTGAVQMFPDGTTIESSTDIAGFDGFFGNCAYNSRSPGLWYVVIGTGGQMRADTCSEVTNFDSVISVYRGICGNLDCVGSDDDGCGSVSSAIIWESELFVNYYIRVQALGDGQAGDFGLTVSTFEPAENDKCPGATGLTVGESVEGSFAVATGEDTQIDCTYVSSSEGSLWYYIDGSATGIEVSSCSPNSTVFGRMQVFGGDSCSDLICELSLSDYDCLYPSTNVKFFAEEGVRYYILFSTYRFDSDGSFTLSVTEFETAENDVCGEATLISDFTEPVIGSTSDALADEAICGEGGGDYAAGVWYKVIGTGDAMSVSTCSRELNFGSSISVYTGGCEELKCLAFQSAYGYRESFCDISFYGSARAIFRTDAESEYYILVSGAYGSESGDFGLTVGPAETPVNDICTSATPLESNGEMIFGSTINATGSFNYNCTFEETAGVWYSFIGDGSVNVISTCSKELNFDAAISVTTGSCDEPECIAVDAFNDYNCLEAGFSAARSVVRTAIGVEYKILIHGAFQGSKGDFGISVSPLETPPNDLCSEAIDVVPNNGTIFGSTLDATDSGATGCFAFGDSPDLWYRVEGTGTSLTASLCGGGTTFDSQIAVYEAFKGVCDSFCLTSNDDTCEFASEIDWFASAGTTYFIRVYGYGANSGSFELTVTGRGGSVQNDFCRGAIPLGIGDLVLGDTSTGAVNSEAPSCEGATDSSSPDLWYSTVGNGETLLASMCGGETEFDTQLTVYGSPCDSLTCIVTNDDGCFTQSEAQWFAAANQTYYIRVHGFSNFDTGLFGLSLTSLGGGGQEETSDVCETAVEVSLFSDTIGSTADASPDPLVTFCGEATSVVSNGVWYKIVGDGQTMEASTCNARTNFDTQISIFTGDCNSAGAAMALLQCVDGNDQFCGDQSLVEWSSLPGVTYYILVHGFLTSTGTFQLSVYPSLFAEEEEEEEATTTTTTTTDVWEDMATLP